MLFLRTLKNIGYKIVHLTFSLITTGGMMSLEAFRSLSKTLTGWHANMSFTIESEKHNRMSLLDLQIICEDKTFTTSVYHKPTFSRVNTHFDSFLPSTYKFGTVFTLPYRCLWICTRIERKPVNNER